MAQSITSLSGEDLGQVVIHPTQLQTIEVVAELVEALRQCASAQDCHEFQRLLFRQLFSAEKQRGSVRRCRKRIERGQSLPVDAPDLHHAHVPMKPRGDGFAYIAWPSIKTVGPLLERTDHLDTPRLLPGPDTYRLCQDAGRLHSVHGDLRTAPGQSVQPSGQREYELAALAHRHRELVSG